jgi:NAD+ synthetase
MKITIAQIDVITGDIQANFAKIIDIYTEACANNSDIVIFPELALCGSLMQDAMLYKHFLQDIEEYLLKIAAASGKVSSRILLGAPVCREDKIYNAAILIGGGKILSEFYKKHLTNKDLFCEKSFFDAGDSERVFEFNGVKIGVVISGDVLYDDVVIDLKRQEVDLLISLNNSYFELEKQSYRMTELHSIVAKTGISTVYVNRIGADDHIVFDGGSCLITKDGFVSEPLYWVEKSINIAYEKDAKLFKETAPLLKEEEQIYNALISGVRGFFLKNGFKKAVVGVSGGIDSAFIATLLADCIGSQEVICIAMPSIFSSDSSLADAKDVSSKLACYFQVIPINEFYLNALTALRSIWGDLPFDETEENLQSRIRAVFLMAIANKNKALLIATSNKSECAVGYATIYGDTCGALAPIGDIYKTTIYKLAKWRNENIPMGSKNPKLNIINDNIIAKPPSAELREDQKDEDSLPPYEILDRILYSLIEMSKCSSEVAEDTGLSIDLVNSIESMLIKNEFKRRQSPFSIKISKKALTLERKYPNTFCNKRDVNKI